MKVVIKMVREQIMGNKFKYKSHLGSKLRRVIIFLLIIYFVTTKTHQNDKNSWGLQHGSFEFFWFFQVKSPRKLQSHNSNINLWLKSFKGIHYNPWKDLPVVRHCMFHLDINLTFVSLVLMVGSWIVNLILIIFFA
jgi:hypothetical protein